MRDVDGLEEIVGGKGLLVVVVVVEVKIDLCDQKWIAGLSNDEGDLCYRRCSLHFH